MGAVVVSALTAGCSADPIASDDYQELRAEATSLEQQVAALKNQLATLTVERDQLVAEREADAARYATVQEFTELRNNVAGDPAAYGTEDQVLDLLSSGAATDAVMVDEVYGTFPLRRAWRNTLFGTRVDAVTSEWRSWICSDGRLGGSLWTWEGSNYIGEPFSLIGINLNQYDDEGLLTESRVIWPYPWDYVVDEFQR